MHTHVHTNVHFQASPKAGRPKKGHSRSASNASTASSIDGESHAERLRQMMDPKLPPLKLLYHVEVRAILWLKQIALKHNLKNCCQSFLGSNQVY